MTIHRIYLIGGPEDGAILNHPNKYPPDVWEVPIELHSFTAIGNSTEYEPWFRIGRYRRQPGTLNFYWEKGQ